MNIEIANRLVQLRKQHGYSQEELAAKLGLSRQAVSKWERAEASPDTDNLIMLSRVYGVSLDELLKTDEPIPEPESDKGVKVTINGKPLRFNLIRTTVFSSAMATRMTAAKATMLTQMPTFPPAAIW